MTCWHPQATWASGRAWLNGSCHAWPVGLELKLGHGSDRALCRHDPLKIVLGLLTVPFDHLVLILFLKEMQTVNVTTPIIVKMQQKYIKNSPDEFCHRCAQLVRV
jgi:hypothetical protein